MRVGGHLWKKKDDAEGRGYLVEGRRSFGWVVNLAPPLALLALRLGTCWRLPLLVVIITLFPGKLNNKQFS